MKLLITFGLFSYFFVGSNVWAASLDYEKAKIKASLIEEDNTDSDVTKIELAWEAEWKFREPLTINDGKTDVMISSKPYYKFTDTELLSEETEKKEFGIDAAKVVFKFPVFHPFIAIGIEDINTKTTDADGNVSRVDETATHFSFGIKVPLYPYRVIRGEGTEDVKEFGSVEIYISNKYTNFYEDKLEDERGIKLEFNVLELFQAVRK